jgi:salicylate 5-hydroxylase large subunit
MCNVADAKRRRAVDRENAMQIERRWPSEGTARVPYWIYSDRELYAREQERIFCGPSWSYVALEAEIPKAGDFKRTFVGDKSVVVLRDQDGGINVVENRCAHRGVQFCQAPFGNHREIMCPYHQWTYDLKGNLIGVPFRRGLKQQGGMPDDFDLARNGLRKLAVARRNGVVFASFARDVESFEDYLTPTLLELFDRVFDGRELTVLGYQRQLTPANWKLMFENIKDPYHATLLHVFLLSFGLNRADSPNRLVIDPSGRHAAGMSWRAEQKHSEDTKEMRSLKADLRLNDPTMLQPVKEYERYTICLMTVWPNLIVQQQSNTLALRQLITRGPGAFELSWTFFGYATDDEEMTRRRLRQANLMGPAGFVSIDDSEVMAFTQRGVAAAPDAAGIIEMDGRGWRQEESHAITESEIRGFYDYYRRIMEL